MIIHTGIKSSITKFCCCWKKKFFLQKKGQKCAFHLARITMIFEGIVWVWMIHYLRHDSSLNRWTSIAIFNITRAFALSKVYRHPLLQKYNGSVASFFLLFISLYQISSVLLAKTFSIIPLHVSCIKKVELILKLWKKFLNLRIKNEKQIKAMQMFKVKKWIWKLEYCLSEPQLVFKRCKIFLQKRAGTVEYNSLLSAWSIGVWYNSWHTIRSIDFMQVLSSDSVPLFASEKRERKKAMNSIVWYIKNYSGSMDFSICFHCTTYYATDNPKHLDVRVQARDILRCTENPSIKTSLFSDNKQQ